MMFVVVVLLFCLLAVVVVVKEGRAAPVKEPNKIPERDPPQFDPTPHLRNNTLGQKIRQCQCLAVVVFPVV